MKRITAGIFIALTVGSTGASRAQEAPSCPATAATVAQTTRPTTEDTSETATRALFYCSVSGPAQIARLWVQPGLSSKELLNLRAYTSGFLDQRIVDTLSAISRRVSVATEVRQSALAVLASYINPTLPVSPGTLREMGRDLRDASVTDGGVVVSGSVPTTLSSRRAIVQLFAELASQTSDIGVREVARAAFRGSNQYAPELVTIPSGMVTLTYMCGNRFRVRNTSPLDLLLRYDVYGTTETREFTVLGASSARPVTEVFFPSRRRGTVRIFYRSQLLQTKANGGTVCSG